MKQNKNNKNKRGYRTVQPLISVVMPVYNAALFLRLALDSILAQTYQNFEFIIVDDASTDNSYQILVEYAKRHKNIRLFRNSKNLGVSETVKKATDEVQGDFIARMDADDVSLPHRFEKQVAHFLKNPQTVALGGQCLLINEHNITTGKKSFPTDYKNIYKYIFQFIPVQQPTLMIARNRLPGDFEFYRNGLNTAEEVDLLFKLFTYGFVENLAEPVLCYRIHSANTSLMNVKKTFALTLISRIKAIYQYGYRPTLGGIAITILQAICVFLLPQRVTLGLYRLIRRVSSYKMPRVQKLQKLPTEIFATQKS